MKKYIYLILLIFLSFALFSYETHIPKGDLLSRQLIHKTGKKLGKKYNMEISVVGGGTKDGIWLISVHFSRYGEKPLTILEARKIIVDCTKEFLEDINNDHELRPYLQAYPFTASNLQIDIFNFTENKTPIIDPYVYIVAVSRGKLEYLTKDSNKKYGYKSEISETYEEAINILENERVQIQKQN